MNSYPSTKAQVQHETSTTHHLRVVLDEGLIADLSSADEVVVHLCGFTDVPVRLSYSQVRRLVEERGPR